MPQRDVASVLVPAGKAAGAFAWVVSIAEWFCSITIERWTIYLAFMGAVLYVIAMAYDLMRKRKESRLIGLQIRVTEKHLLDLGLEIRADD